MPGKKTFGGLVKTLLKVVGIIVFVVLVAISVVSWVVLESKNEWLLEQIQSYLSESQSGEVGIESVSFTVFHSFPDVTVELNGISYYERVDTLRAPDEAPILVAGQMFIAMKLLPLMNDELSVSEISISDAQLNILRNADGKLNIELALAHPAKPGKSPTIVSKKKPGTPPARKTPAKPPIQPGETEKKVPLKIDLEYITLQNVRLTWHSYASADTTVILMRDIKADLTSQNSVLNVGIRSASAIESLSVNGYSIPAGAMAINTRFQYEPSSQKLTISEGEITNGFLSATFDGFYAHKDSAQLDVNIDASSNDLKLLSMILKPQVLSTNKAKLESGDIYARGRVFGKLISGAPQFEVAFGVKDLDLQLPRKLGTMKGIGFDGSIKSGDKPDFSGAFIEINKLRGNIPGGYVRGGFSIRNLKEPYVKLDVAAQLALDGYDEVFKVEAIKNLQGKVSVWAKFDGPLKLFGQHEMDSSRSSAITLDNISFVLNKTNKNISSLSGKVENRNNHATISDLTFHYGESELQLDATVDNLVYVLIGRERNIRANGHVQSRQLFTADFILDTTSVAQVKDRISNLAFDFQIQAHGRSKESPDIVPTISFSVAKLKSNFDKLPNIVQLDARGVFTKVAEGIRLDVESLGLVLPQGRTNVKGKLLVASRRKWQFDARAKVEDLPWIYIADVAAEISPGAEPTAKNLPPQRSKVFTADLDVSAAIITYPFDFERLEIRDSRVKYTLVDLKPLSANKINVNLSHLSFIHPPNAGNIIGLKSTSGLVALEGLTVPGLHPVDLKLDVQAKNDTIQASFTSATQAAKTEQGTMLLDISRDEFAYELKYQVDDANLEPFAKKFYKKKFIEGVIDYDLDLKASGTAWDRIKETLSGTVEVRGDSLEFYGVDVDKVLRKFEKSQNFNLTDVGALLIAGPVGLAVTKGADFVSLAKVNLKPTEKTKVKTLLTRWTIEDQQLRTVDVAIATPQNRISFDGVIDVGHDSIPGLTVYVVDAKGCALMDQKLYGKTNALKTGKLNVTKTMLGPVVNFAKAVVGKECTPVYTGRVAAPE